jgi:hypothetical protein
MVRRAEVNKNVVTSAAKNVTKGDLYVTWRAGA